MVVVVGWAGGTETHGCNAWNMRRGCTQRCKHKQTKAYVCVAFRGDAAKAVFYTQPSSGMRIEVYESYYAFSCLLVLAVWYLHIPEDVCERYKGHKGNIRHSITTAQYIYLFLFLWEKGGSDGGSDSFSDHFEIIFAVAIEKNMNLHVLCYIAIAVHVSD